MILLFLIPLFFIWGSFLNVVAYRVIRGESIIRPRSKCSSCHHQLAWYDLIPVISWLFLRGSCRYCKKSVSALYPFIEMITALSLTALYLLVPTTYFFAYALFFSALIVTIRSDLETMLISRLATLCLIPIGILCCTYELLPYSIEASIVGTLLGYGVLWATAKLFLLTTGKEGMGQGDLELLACIGSFVGPFGIWFTLLFSTISGSLLGITYMKLTHKNRSFKIPFGPFLAIAAILYVLFEPEIISFFITT